MPSAAPKKRPRRSAFEDEEDGVLIDEASSSLQSGNRSKKVRLSAGHEKKGSTWPSHARSQDSSDEEASDQEMQEPTPVDDFPSATQYEAERDNGFEHLRHAEEDDIRATQRLKQRPQLIGENHAALNAVIESIEVINFMCHERLKVDLGPLLNFIVGENGSGKSAILTAITLCLGGKASSTNRGASLKSFIKEGQEHGKLIVKIKNQGPDAYKPDLFGESVIVERHFNKTGSSGFKLCSETGRKISTKREDVQDVVDYFCLQVDNPLNVLSQDNARQFLNSATPAVKYKYFLQGTQLQQLDDDLSLIHEHIDATETKLAGFEETFQYLKETMEKAQKLKETAAKNKELRNKTRVYGKQLAWAQVVEQEQILQERDNAIAAADQEIQRMERLIAEEAERLQKHDDRVAAADEELQNLRQQEGELQTQKEEAKENWNKAKDAIQAMHSQQRELHEQLKEANDKFKETEQKIQDEQRRLEDVNGGAVAEKQRALNDAKSAAELAKKELEEHIGKGPVLMQEFAEAEKRLEEAGKPSENKKKEIHAIESRIRNLSQSRGDPFAGYQPQTRQLVKLIDEDGGFSQKPIGPIGMHVRLLKPQWSSILESVFGKTLDGFIVSSIKDQKRLEGLMSRVKMSNRPTIFIKRPGSSIRTLNEPVEGLDTILRILKIDDDRVREQLVITNSIEQILLVDSKDEAWRVMEEQSGNNVKLCIFPNPKKRGEGYSMKFGRGENTGSEPILASKFNRMKTDSEAEINHQNEVLTQLRGDLRELEAARRILDQAARKCSLATSQHKQRESGLKQVVRKADAQISTAEEALDEYDGLDLRLQGLRDELQLAQEKQEHYGQQYGEVAVQKQELNSASGSAKAALAEAKKNCAAFEEQIKSATNKIERAKSARQIAVQEKNSAHENLDVQKEAKNSAKRRRDQQQEVVEDYTRRASDVTPERVFIPEGETYHSIERKFDAIKEQLKKFEDRHGMTEQMIHEQAAKTFEEYDKARIWREDCEHDVRACKDALAKRLIKWRMFQRMISAAARTNFQYLLSERDFRGRLLLDHEHKRLGIEVEPDQTRQNVTGRNTKTLSGGEKSFSSICLLLAIWDAMGSPLRCLDEFDVFMDVVNRGISTKMLVQAARRSVGKQFILITPNAIESNVKYDKDVRIIRLTDPRQRRLTGSQA